MDLPDIITSEHVLDDVMTRPSPELVAFARTLAGPLLVLGAGGKMGPSLAARAKRAATEAGVELEVVAVSRFGDDAARAWLEARGVRTVARNLLTDGLDDLPDASRIVYLVGQKFGTTSAPARTWALNALVPERVCARWPAARFAALSTGNVYPLMPVARGGSVEDDPLTPLGEYANACVARERIFEDASARRGTRVVLLRLNYALDLRYGVLVDLARRILAGEPIDLTTGHVNLIWQGDANDAAIRALDLATAPPRALNLTGREVLSVRELAQRLGSWLEEEPRFTGAEADSALLSDPARAYALLGAPPTPLEAVLRWTAAWVRAGGRTLGKPTRFEVRDGRF
ncbi:MAG TPA: NAD(P)-dependent oxidoreductase [Longimicrobiales bacterium]|nr:NAD(P)-dependent oxidoreductase [Longimicrobiales bacterium]